MAIEDHDDSSVLAEPEDRTPDIEFDGSPDEPFAEVQENGRDADPMQELGDHHIEPSDPLDGEAQAATKLGRIAARVALRWSARASTSPFRRRINQSPGSRTNGSPPAGLPPDDFFEDDGEGGLDDEEDLLSEGLGLGPYELEGNGRHERGAQDHELMEGLAQAAAIARDDVEAEGLIAAMVPLAIADAGSDRQLWPALPELICGSVGLTRLLRSRSATRPLIRHLPHVLRSTAAHLARRADRGEDVTGRLTATVLAAKTAAAIDAAIGTQGRGNPAIT